MEYFSAVGRTRVDQAQAEDGGPTGGGDVPSRDGDRRKTKGICVGEGSRADWRKKDCKKEKNKDEEEAEAEGKSAVGMWTVRMGMRWWGEKNGVRDAGEDDENGSDARPSVRCRCFGFKRGEGGGDGEEDGTSFSFLLFPPMASAFFPKSFSVALVSCTTNEASSSACFTRSNRCR